MKSDKTKTHRQSKEIHDGMTNDKRRKKALRGRKRLPCPLSPYLSKCLVALLSLTLFFCAFPSSVVEAAQAKQEEAKENDVTKTLSPYFFIEGADTSVDCLPLKDTEVHVNINGTIAETYVTQTYANEGKNPISATYVFPASTGVTVHGMKMQIGDQVITAKIKEREEAKEEYEQAKSEGKSASLLEQQRPNVFTMNLSNLMPGQTIRLELHYTELVHATDGVYQFVFPTVVGPRYATPPAEGEEESSGWTATPYLEDGETASGSFRITANLSTGVPITGLSSKSHEIDIAWNSDSNAQVTLSDPSDFAGNRDYILEYRLTGEDIHCGLMLDKGEGEEENFFLLMVQPPARCEPESIPPRDYTFVVDVSGSMEGYPLDTAKELIRSLVTSLKETDTFNVVLFSGASVQLSSKPLPATQENIRAALEIVEGQVGAGGTELAPALENAIALPSPQGSARSIVLVTDGYISGEKAVFDLIRRNLDTTNFFSFGIGGSVNRYLIEGIAKIGGGESFVVTDSKDALEMADRFRTYIQSPVLTDIRIVTRNFYIYDLEPAKLSTLFAQKPIILYGKWSGEPSGSILITGKNGTQDYSQEIQVSKAQAAPQNRAIRYLWARSRVERLMDYGFHFNQDDKAVKKEVTELGLTYSMMTPYTSFIAVLETVQNTTGENTDVDQPQPLPSHVSSLAIGGYLFGSEPELLPLCLLLLLLSPVYFLRRQRKNSQKGGAL